MARFEINEANFADMAATGNAEIMFELGLIYATGRDGDADIVAAHKWFNLSAYRGNELAKERREELAYVMDKSQIAEAQRAAREWITTH